MYIRKNIADFLEKMPKEMKMPKNWKKFVKKYDIEYNLLIKHGKECECTNCGKYFYSEQVEGKGCWDICPFCNNQYDVRRSNLKNYFFLYDLAIIDNVDNKLILRYFEVYRKYDYKTRRFKDDIVEYARIVPELDIEIVNDRFIKYLSFERVYHTKKIKRWRIFTGMYGLGQYYKAIYLDNIYEKTKGTIYQYAPIKEAIEYLDNKKVDLLKLLEKAKYPSFELLMKAGLYKLALNCPEKFNQKGSFEKRFGLPKEYYKFMKKHDVSEKELCVLKLIKRKNINIINKLLKISNENIEDLEKVSRIINLIKLKDYSKKQQGFSVQNYLDYIRNLEKLNVPLTNKILLPENFTEAHDISIEKVEIVNNKLINKKIKQRYKQLSKNIYSDNTFFIRPAKNLKDMEDESKQQINCVYKNYSEDYAYGNTDIYFLRNINKPEKSLVTVEVNKNKIRQKYQKKNTKITKEQDIFLKIWEKNIIQKVA